MRRLLIVVFGVLLCGNPSAGQVAMDDSAESLARACENAIQFPTAEEVEKAPVAEQAAIFFNAACCKGYFAGVLDLNSLYSGMFPTFFCLPKEGLPRDEAIKIFLKYAKDHPEFSRKKSRSIVASALADVLPCP